MYENLKRYLTASVVMLLVVSLFAAAVGSAGSLDESEDESISADDPIEIYDWHDLNETRNNLEGEYILMSDLDETTNGYDELVNTTDGWKPIGEDLYPAFSGTFKGNGYKISDLYINREITRVGLFGAVDGKLTNVGL
ncbi:MAG: hypothetical protein V5A88_10415, partial [Candidatus Thermoplasmatota archaeon]